jgi:hypothetical protein
MESGAQSILQHLEEEFRAELEEKQHIFAALNTKVGPGTAGASETYSRLDSVLNRGKSWRRSSTSLHHPTPM